MGRDRRKQPRLPASSEPKSPSRLRRTPAQTTASVRRPRECSMVEGTSTAAAPCATTTTQHMRNITLRTGKNGRLGAKQETSMREGPAPQPVHDTSAPIMHEPTTLDGSLDETLLSSELVTPECIDPMSNASPATHTRRKWTDHKAAKKVETWLSFRDEYLDEILRGEGRRGYPFTTCSRCGCLPAIGDMYRCIDCGIFSPHCADCILALHSTSGPSGAAFHRPEFWNGSFFQTVSLSSLGLVINLGHDGALCPDPAPGVQELLVFHTNGYHRVKFRMCGCAITVSEAPPSWRQLLRADLFPSTHQHPKSAFSFAVLKLFHETNLQAKTNMYDFYHALLRVTDNSGVAKHPFCHDPAGVNSTAQGALAVTCAAWIYTLYLMMDANFRCRCKDRGLEDIELAPGWSYYVEEAKFREYLKKAGLDVDENSCSAEHNAILNANLCKEGYVASGVGAVLCACHALFRPNGTADLHLGEKFAYMDYLLVSTLLGVFVLFLVISYDIACQYCRNFEARLERNFPADKRPDLEEVKNHIAVHGPHHSQFSLNFADKVARTYGEGVELSWSHLNPVSVSTREMALATRHEVLNDHMGSWNWQKTIGFAAHFNKTLKTANKMGKKHRDLFQEFSATFSPEVVQAWTRTLEQWSVDPHSVSDPFDEPQSFVNTAHVCVELGREDRVNVASALPQLPEMSPLVFVQLGLELEDCQRVLRSKRTRDHADKDVADMLQQQNALRRWVYLWIEVQNVYMPSVLQLRLQTGTAYPATIQHDSPLGHGPDGHDNDHDVETVDPEDIILWVPSSLLSSLRVGDFTLRLVDIELRLRIAQAADSLNDICRLRRMLKSISEFKRINFNRKQAHAVERYRAARKALLSLDPNGKWKRQYRELLDSALTGPGVEDDGPGEGDRVVSWIWRVPRDDTEGGENEANEYNESMRAEWARTKARADRWTEEEDLLLEEMRRVLVSFKCDAEWWDSFATRRAASSLAPPISCDILDGIQAYARRQASIRRELANKCARLWLPTLRKLDLHPQWGEEGSGCDDSGSDESDYDTIGGI
ncbi:hypothetical protein C8Q79DRAFT_1002434 [Trametes meyenii]|nr:hypothetical protein C8Q79DRAFT_1002434 [Trametes meyenii]